VDPAVAHAAENAKDLVDIPTNVKRDLQIIEVDHMDEVLVAALSLENPDVFLRDGDHDFDDIHEVPLHKRPPVEVPVPAEVN